MELIWNIYEHNINCLKPCNNVDKGNRLNVKNAIPCLNKNTVNTEPSFTQLHSHTTAS